MVVLTPYASPHFFTPVGAWMKTKQLKKRGFPSNLRNWRFVTLTVDRAHYPDAEQAYEIGKRRLRQFMYLLRKRYSIPRWCWKLELHSEDENGERYPHWHLLLDYKRPIPCEFIDQNWGMGRTEIKGITDARFEYLFKYVSKNVSDLPDWLTARSSVRMFQTSKGFFPADCQPHKQKKPSPRQGDTDRIANTQNDKLRRLSIGERLERWSRLAVSRIQSPAGGIHYRTHVMTETWGTLRAHVCRVKFAQALSESELQIHSHKIKTSCLRLLPSYLPKSSLSVEPLAISR